MFIAQKMPVEFLGEVSIYVGIGVEVLMALFLGGLVGYDREKKSKTAGLKTNMLICLGATLYTTIGILVATAATAGSGDPTRIAAQIVSGIGFLGAGSIIQSRGNVIGMTTAATIWTMGAIGFTIGAGYPFSAMFFSITVLLVLKMINPLYKFIETSKNHKYYQLEILSKGSVERMVVGILYNENLHIDEVYEEAFEEKKSKVILSVFVTGHQRQIERAISEVKTSLRVEKAVFHVVTKQVSDHNQVHHLTS